MSTRFAHRVERWYERLSLLRAVATVLVVAVILVAGAGLLMRLVEPDTYGSLGSAYWWAVQTVTTVGYGDNVPETAAGRLVASVLMLIGIALIPTLTSVIVSALLSKHRHAEQDRVEQLENEQGVILSRIEERLARIEGER